LYFSASQQSGELSDQNDVQTQDDYPMVMEAPDSPPETNQVPTANHSAALSGSQTAASSQVAGGNRGSETKINHGAPGSSWNNKKWQEEYERSYALLLDQNWDPCEFGSLAFSPGRD
jgi:hypothetical protein